LRTQGISSELDATIGWDNNLLSDDQCKTIRLEPLVLRIELEDKMQGNLHQTLHCGDHRSDWRILQHAYVKGI